MPATILNEAGVNVLLILITSSPGSAAVHRSVILSTNTSIRCDAATDTSRLRLKIFRILQGAWPSVRWFIVFLFMVFSPEVETGMRYKKNKTLRKLQMPLGWGKPCGGMKMWNENQVGVISRNQNYQLSKKWQHRNKKTDAGRKKMLVQEKIIQQCTNKCSRIWENNKIP